MKALDILKALGVALLIMTFDFACAFAFVFLWVQLNHPATPLTMTDPATIALSTLSTRIFGPILFALFVWLFSRRRPDRNAWLFALVVFGLYALIDWSMVGFKGVFSPLALGTMGLKLAGALAGAAFATLSRRRA